MELPTGEWNQSQGDCMASIKDCTTPFCLIPYTKTWFHTTLCVDSILCKAQIYGRKSPARKCGIFYFLGTSKAPSPTLSNCFWQFSPNLIKRYEKVGKIGEFFPKVYLSTLTQSPKILTDFNGGPLGRKKSPIKIARRKAHFQVCFLTLNFLKW